MNTRTIVGPQLSSGDNWFIDIDRRHKKGIVSLQGRRIETSTRRVEPLLGDLEGILLGSQVAIGWHNSNINR